MPLEGADAWPDLMQVVREKVKPERDLANRKAHRDRWWQYGDWRPGLFSAIEGKDRMLCVVFVSQHLGFVWLPTNTIVSHNVGVFATDRDEFFCVVQSRPHEVFATQLSSGLEDRQGYRPSDGFEPFPFPLQYQSNEQLGATGREYEAHRSNVMITNGEGLTKTYNRFHDPHEKSPEILKLRELHEAMDRAVLEAYGWHDLAETAKCEFLLDYEEDDEETGKKKSTRKKPWRLRWPDDFRDEVLARLLELNEKRHKEELLAASSQLAEGKKAAQQDAPAKPKLARKKAAEGQKGLEFDNG
jgi:hypothetical protein